MRIRRLWWLGATAMVALLLGVFLVVPAWASPSRQVDGPAPDVYATMHQACAAGDVQGMIGAMSSLTDGDWEAMEEYMSNGHHGTMGFGMMGWGAKSLADQSRGIMGRW